VKKLTNSSANNLLQNDEIEKENGEKKSESTRVNSTNPSPAT
jgi:hypothetical protein